MIRNEIIAGQSLPVVGRSESVVCCVVSGVIEPKAGGRNIDVVPGVYPSGIPATSRSSFGTDTSTAAQGEAACVITWLCCLAFSVLHLYIWH